MTDITFGLWNNRDPESEREIIIPGTSNKFHDLERIALHAKEKDIDPYIIFCVGARGIGKTGTLNELMMEAYNEGLQTIWTRNFKEIFRNPNFARNFLNLGKRFNGVPEEFTATSEGVFDDEKGGNLVTTFMGINTGTELKGNEYSDVKYLLCDEFMVLPTERYPPGAPEKLGVMLNSLRTYADACVLMSNFTFMTNPYWASMNIFPKYNKGVTGFKDKATLIEVCEKGYYNRVQYDDNDPRAIALNYLQGGSDHSAYDQDPNYELIRTIPTQHTKRMDIDISTPAMTIGFYQHGSGKIYAKKDERVKEHHHYVTDPALLDETNMFILPFVEKWLGDTLNMGDMRFFSANVLYEVMRIIHKI